MKSHLEEEFLEHFNSSFSKERAFTSLAPFYKHDILKSNLLRNLIANVDYLPFGLTISAVKAKPGVQDAFDFPIAYCNEMFTRITGFKRDSIIGKDFMFMEKESVIELELITRLVNGLNRAEHTSVIITNFTSQMEAFRHLNILHPLFDQDGCYAYVVALHFDITMTDSVNIIGKMAVEIMRELPPRCLDL